MTPKNTILFSLKNFLSKHFLLWAGPCDDVDLGTAPHGIAGLWLCYPTMGRNCIVYGCSNTQKKGHSLFGFPKDPKLIRQWTLQVQRTRECWKGPTAYSAVCSEHFTPDCFQSSSWTSKSLDIKLKQLLKPGAIPTIFPRPSSVKRLQPRSSSAYEKQERARVFDASWLFLGNYRIFLRYELTFLNHTMNLKKPLCPSLLSNFYR